MNPRVFDYGWKEMTLFTAILENEFIRGKTKEQRTEEFDWLCTRLRTYRPRKIIRNNIEQYCQFPRNPKTLQLRKVYLEQLALLIIKDFIRYYETAK